MNIKLILISLLLINLSACETFPEQRSSSLEQTTPRTLNLRVKQFTERKPGEFTSWKCNDYSDGGKTLVEVGQIPSDYLKQISEKQKSDSVIKTVGFVLYDGSNSGDITTYERRGLNQRWDWGSNGSYSFIIKPDGTGLFYDFSSTKEGEKIKANEIYKCRKW